MTVELFDRGVMDNRRATYTLNTNKVAGLKTAVANGQTRLALEYAELIILDLVARVEELESGNSPVSEKAESTTVAEVPAIDEKPKARTKKTTEEPSKDS